MANNVNVEWIQVSNIKLNTNGTGLNNYTEVKLFDNTSQKSTLNFGNVQAGKVTSIKGVIARFSGASQVSDLQFWLDSTDANATGSTNIDLSIDMGWNFYYCIIPQDKLNFNFEAPTLTDSQKKGDSYLDNGGKYKMKAVKTNVDEVPVSQFSQETINGDEEPLVLNIQTGGTEDSHLILLDVQTPSDANSGNTEGWYYRMNFLYS